jgi:hypothetical protein
MSGNEMDEFIGQIPTHIDTLQQKTERNSIFENLRHAPSLVARVFFYGHAILLKSR